MTKGRFVVKAITKFSDLMAGRVTEISESDLVFQTDDFVVQFEHKKGSEEEGKYEVKPGFYTLVESNTGLRTSKVEFKKRQLLEDLTSTKAILNEARTFFRKLNVYEQLGRPKKRGVLLYSSPGCGKSSAVEKFCMDSFAEDPGTVVLMWPTSQVDADSVLNFFNTRVEYTKECTRLILILEDIGGGERDETHSRAVDSGMLNLLDGIGLTFKLPTFIVATTNHPESLLESLADRPGRFDLVLKLSPPTHQEKIRLLTFIAKRDLTDEEKNCLGRKGTEDFSVAHLEEIAIRSLLHDKTYMQVVQEMIDHSKLFSKAFQERGSVGF